MTNLGTAQVGAAQVISEELLELLVCPVDHAKLEIDGNALRCTSCSRHFPVNDGIPNMLIED